MLSDIKAYHKIDDRLVTSGLPTEAQFAEIGAAGFQTVINLLPMERYPDLDAERLVREQGMEYVNIPVEWTAPQITDAQAFFAAMDARPTQPLWVHCAANMRVSAFVYLWRTLRQGVPEDTARADLQALWEPNPVWQEFIAAVKAHSNVSSS